MIDDSIDVRVQPGSCVPLSDEQRAQWDRVLHEAYFTRPTPLLRRVKRWLRGERWRSTAREPLPLKDYFAKAVWREMTR